MQKIAPDKTERKAWNAKMNLKLVKLEQAVVMAGHPKAFLLFMDSGEICAECAPTRAGRKTLKHSRPSPEGMAVDVFSNVRNPGYPMEVLTDTQQTMNRYAFLMID
jgi:predicted metal-binding protein